MIDDKVKDLKEIEELRHTIRILKERQFTEILILPYIEKLGKLKSDYIQKYGRNERGLKNE